MQTLTGIVSLVHHKESTAFPSSNPTKVIRKHLKSVYKVQNFFQRANGPKVRNIQFIPLVMEKKQGIREEDKWKKRPVMDTLHGLVDDIAKKKSKLDMGDIFKYGKKARKLVLVEGAPGIGKTMLAMKLCQSWAEGKLLDEYDVVLLVELRRFEGATKLTLEDLINVYLEGNLGKQVAEHFMQTMGEKLLIILDGWDKLPSTLCDEFSLFFGLIRGDKLPNASIMVTCRPLEKSPLYDYMDECSIKILGFCKEQQKEYIQKNTPSHELAEEILSHIEAFPEVQNLAHVPLLLAAICFKAIEHSPLPHSQEELNDISTKYA